MMDKIASFPPKVGQDATFTPTFKWHNLAILSDFYIRTHQNDQLVETNRIV